MGSINTTLSVAYSHGGHDGAIRWDNLINLLIPSKHYNPTGSCMEWGLDADLTTWPEGGTSCAEIMLGLWLNKAKMQWGHVRKG